MSWNRTHDTSSIGFHLKDLETFGKILTSAASAAFPNKGKFRYREVHVLLLSWEEDNLGVIHEVSELQNVFRDKYNFHTEEWKIPSKRSHNSLAMKIVKFLEAFEAKDNLLIVYYGGHGAMSDGRHCVWLCSDAADSSKVEWFGLQTMLEQAKCDVLILLDCCAAASSIAESGSGVTEVICACGFETSAPGVGVHSFTRSLIDVLKYMSLKASVAMLHTKVLSKIKEWNPQYCSDNPREQRSTPIHILLSDELNQGSIEIAPLPLNNLSNTASPDVSSSPPSYQPSLPSSESTEDIEMLSAASSNSSLDEYWPDPQFKCPKVLVSVALEDDQQLQIDGWRKWLISIPALTKYAKVEGIYLSDSVLILLSLPIPVWDFLPRNPAISFIKFVRSRNMLDVIPSQTESITHSSQPGYSSVKEKKWKSIAPVSSPTRNHSSARRLRIIRRIERDREEPKRVPYNIPDDHCKQILEKQYLNTPTNLTSPGVMKPHPSPSVKEWSTHIMNSSYNLRVKPAEQPKFQLAHNDSLIQKQGLDPLKGPSTPSTSSGSPDSPFQSAPQKRSGKRRRSTTETDDSTNNSRCAKKKRPVARTPKPTRNAQASSLYMTPEVSPENAPPQSICRGLDSSHLTPNHYQVITTSSIPGPFGRRAVNKVENGDKDRSGQVSSIFYSNSQPRSGSESEIEIS